METKRVFVVSFKVALQRVSTDENVTIDCACYCADYGNILC